MRKGIAFFDFDGTITSKDTLLEFIKFVKGDFYFYLGFLIFSPILIAMKLNLITNHRAKEYILSYFFKDNSIKDFQSNCNNFTLIRLPSLLRQEALQEIRRLKDLGIKIVIVSASPENWIQQWTETNEIDLIGTKLLVNKNILTGKIDGANCYGIEKVKRIKEKYVLSEFAEIYAYGDSKGDIPMLEIAEFRFMKPFRKVQNAKHI